MKTCTKCEKEKELCEFNKDSHQNDGLNQICRFCINTRRRKYNQSAKGIEYRDKNKEKTKLHHKKYRSNNKDKIKIRGIAYVKANRDKTNANSRNSYQRHKEKICANNRQYHLDNLEEKRADDRRYREGNKINIRASYKKYYNKYIDKNRKRAKQWTKDNPEKDSARSAQRRAKKLNATPEWLIEFDLDYIKHIYIQAKELENIDGVKRHVDHILPLQGKDIRGLHVPWNLQILTAEENCRKGNR